MQRVLDFSASIKKRRNLDQNRVKIDDLWKIPLQSVF
ncbi:hypothetical protein LCGC14_2830730, partial [marine sediment metagenome]